ncbi:aldehyde dehydrogenase family protein [Nocardia sp. NBC_01009]|uniref:aldehyde dehydrogenase family protein n=1 Tax=Nocardia sp. NBC_01009 TaxID=2975996 RepID=UPI0038700D87|nr:aldehyde dehydrogenase family protein [Nocardia sp. NBC_01009]
MSTIWDRDAVLIDGNWRRAAEIVEVQNPATEETVGTAASAQVSDVDDAVAAAVRARRGWAQVPPAARISALRTVLAELLQRRDDLVAATVAEVGAPVTIAEQAHIDCGLDVFAGFLNAAPEALQPQHIGNSVLLRKPAGVVAAITPWNYPFYQLVAKLGAALVAGCPIVIKPAELTPLSAYLVADAVQAAGIPDGVVNLVPGTGTTVGAALVAHPQVDVVSFTGSTAVGRSVALSAADRFARACLELGGKSASVVLDDADLAAAVQGTVASAMLNSGQTCSALTRLLVPRAQLPEALELAAVAAGALVVGDPTARDTDMGPLISERQRAAVAQHVSGALDRGARLVAGGPGRPAGLDRGHYLAPTVLAHLEADDPAVIEEIFGPVLVVSAHDGDDHAIELANSGPYGLSGAVWSADAERALATSDRMDTGQVDINGAPFNPLAPFGGWKASGSGRELGRSGIEEYTELTSVQR